MIARTNWLWLVGTRVSLAVVVLYTRAKQIYMSQIYDMKLYEK